MNCEIHTFDFTNTGPSFTFEPYDTNYFHNWKNNNECAMIMTEATMRNVCQLWKVLVEVDLSWLNRL